MKVRLIYNNKIKGSPGYVVGLARLRTVSLTGLPVVGVSLADAKLQEKMGNHNDVADSDDYRDVLRCRKGDGEVYRHIVNRHQDRVSAMMWRFSRDPAIHEELVQEVFVQAYMSLGGYRPVAPFAHWLARIATRTGYHYWKKQEREKARQKVSLDDCGEMAANGIDGMTSEEAAEILEMLMSRLPPRDRLILTLRFVEDMSVEEAAEKTGWSRTMVKVQTLRARKKLRKILEKAELRDLI